MEDCLNFVEEQPLIALERGSILGCSRFQQSINPQHFLLVEVDLTMTESFLIAAVCAGLCRPDFCEPAYWAGEDDPGGNRRKLGVELQA